ncbi:hypothetical protein KSP39_PZI020635 [Platanthera zijinensis]|uniref:Uncharacterized protein n=1 Tax=Platanthera zijinensis TaxID=2320716 RepID=A0AAP0B0J9_9ASPA
MCRLHWRKKTSQAMSFLPECCPRSRRLEFRLSAGGRPEFRRGRRVRPLLGCAVGRGGRGFNCCRVAPLEVGEEDSTVVGLRRGRRRPGFLRGRRMVRPVAGIAYAGLHSAALVAVTQSPAPPHAPPSESYSTPRPLAFCPTVQVGQFRRVKQAGRPPPKSSVRRAGPLPPGVASEPRDPVPLALSEACSVDAFGAWR